MHLPNSTQEIYYSTKRQGWLVDQGYSFKIITSLDGLEALPGLVYPTTEDQVALLHAVLTASEADAELGSDMKDAKGDLPNSVMSRVGGPLARRDGVEQVTRVVGNINTLSGCVVILLPSILWLLENDWTDCFDLAAHFSYQCSIDGVH